MKKITSKYSFIILTLLLVACKPNKEDLKNKVASELKKIDWNTVDQYPSTALCDELKNDTLQKKCFFDFVNSHLLEKISTDKLVPNRSNTIIKAQLIIFPNKNVKIFFIPQNKKDSLFQKEYQAALGRAIVNFPELKPAIKRNLYVKTKFEVLLQLP